VRIVTAPAYKNGEKETGKRRKAGPVQVAQAVFWSFFGIRKRSAHEKDAVSITLVQAIVAGLIGAAILVTSLVFLVGYITG
jgi:hypothetical protein